MAVNELSDPFGDGAGGTPGGGTVGPAGTPTANAVTVQGVATTNNPQIAYAASKIIKASPGALTRLNGFNSKTTGQFIQLHDSATLPADTVAPVDFLYAPPLSNWFFDYNMNPKVFAVGIVACNSSTGPTKTIGAADCSFVPQYN